MKIRSRGSALALVVLSLACRPGRHTTASQDAGSPDAGPGCFCSLATESCGQASPCCPGLSCTGAICAPVARESCIPFGEICGPGNSCCGAISDAGGVACIQDPMGMGHCSLAGPGDPCGRDEGCLPSMVCLDGGCGVAATGVPCGAQSQCHIGDDCSSLSSGRDPCSPYGLYCAYDDGGLSCMPPFVDLPTDPWWPSEFFPGGSTSTCSAQGPACSRFAGQRFASVCRDHLVAVFGGGPQVCFEGCASADDCDSPAWDCIEGRCDFRYCYAGDVATGALLDSAQDGGVSFDAGVLFGPCDSDATRFCLPRYDPALYMTVGVCVRVALSDGGGVGNSCDPSLSERQCPAGTTCFHGACRPWCDANQVRSQPCPQSLECVPVGGLFSNDPGASDLLGACVEACDPYLPADENPCQQAPQPACSAATRLCKPALPSDTDADLFPRPGVCVDGFANPIAVAQPCEAGGRADPCVSGALCSPEVPGGDGGPRWLCRQVCDPRPSPGVDAPACSGGTVCVPVGTDLCTTVLPLNGNCRHFGVCS
jgi:hypothetical protein